MVEALFLGARGIGIGRAALFGLGAGGVAGVERTLENQELQTAMRLLGANNIDELGTQNINTRALG